MLASLALLGLIEKTASMDNIILCLITAGLLAVLLDLFF